MHNFFIILSVYGKVTPLGGTLPPAIHVEAISHKCAKHQVCLLLAVSNSEFINLSYAAVLLSAVVYTGYATKYASRTSSYCPFLSIFLCYYYNHRHFPSTSASGAQYWSFISFNIELPRGRFTNLNFSLATRIYITRTFIFVINAHSELKFKLWATLS